LGDKDMSMVIQEIKNGEVKLRILYLRNLVDDRRLEEYDEQKKTLIAFTPSATYHQRRKKEFINNYSGFIVLDIDDVTGNLLIETKEKARCSPFTYACFISPSGNGLKIIIRTESTVETHSDIFKELATYYENYLNVFIDESGKDITRLCLYSFDPSTYFNEQSEIFKLN
jgi:hypothetical protein